MPNNRLRHLAIIMDGNGRWAQGRQESRILGHEAGARAIEDAVKNSLALNIEVLTLFAFSLENWLRPKDEVDALMGLFARSTQYIDQMNTQGVRLHFIGDLDTLSPTVRSSIDSVQAQTLHNTQMTLNIAISYSGRWDIAQAINQVLSSGAASDAVTMAHIEQHLSLAGTPDPDLLIRTGGERRISNYLLWQLAYTELYFTDVLWPDFDRAELERAVHWFGQCERRYGKISSQLAT